MWKVSAALAWNSGREDCSYDLEMPSGPHLLHHPALVPPKFRAYAEGPFLRNLDATNEKPHAGATTQAFAKEDDGDDTDFYVPVRLVTHIDEAATQALTAYYRANLPVGGVLLDLISSWVSHLPEDAAFREAISLGMNVKEARWRLCSHNREKSLDRRSA